MFFSRPVIFGTWSLLFCYAQRPVISLSRFIQQFDAVLVTTVQHLCERGLIHSAKRCSHNDRLNGGVLSKRMCLLWTPPANDLLNGFKSTSQNTDLLCAWAQYISLLKWTKLQLSNLGLKRGAPSRAGPRVDAPLATLKRRLCKSLYWLSDSGSSHII
jgi:hypothetical protein